jgi:hypothetical protein
MRLALKLAAGLAGVYLLASAALLGLMCQPPERFARIVAKLPGLAFMLLPFESLWSFARSGPLRVNDRVPDFELERLDHTGRVRLSSFQQQSPVVLIFGSYT